MLEDKVFLPTDPGWIEGMENWEPLATMEALVNWMPVDPALPPPLPSSGAWPVPAAAMEDSAAVRRVRAWKRWLARCLDGLIWTTLLWLVGLGLGYLGLWDLALRHPLRLVAATALWIPVEAMLIARFTTTPGKWLMGIRVVDALGQPLGTGAALKRSALVQVAGNGLGLPIAVGLPLVQSGMAWVLYRRTGSSIWDQASASQVQHLPVTPLGFVGAILTVVVWFFLICWISLTAPLPVDFPPELRQMLEERRRVFEQGLPASPSPKNGVT